MPTIRFEGIDDVAKVLDGLSVNMRKKLIRNALKVSARPMQRKARAYAPKKSGTLRRSIRTAELKRLKTRPTEAVVGLTIFATRAAGAGAKKDKYYPFYGRFLHEGNAKRNIRANPFIKRAYDEENANTLNAFASNLGQSVEKYVKKQALKK